jgi:hypothetical protein
MPAANVPGLRQNLAQRRKDAKNNQLCVFARRGPIAKSEEPSFNHVTFNDLTTNDYSARLAPQVKSVRNQVTGATLNLLGNSIHVLDCGHTGHSFTQ